MVALLLLSSGCTRIEREDPLPVEEESEGINFAPQIASTKGLLNSGDLNEIYTRIQVYDYISGFTGKINNTTVSGETIKYFSDVISYDNTQVQYWPYWNPDKQGSFGTGAPDTDIVYPWTKTGTHTFFGWLVADGKTNPNTMATQLFGTGQPALNETTRVLSIPTTTMTNTVAQFDFSYSSAVSIDAATRTVGTPVPLQLKHLFSAFRITARNTSGNTILLKSVTLKGMKNSRSATIDFKDVPPTVQPTINASGTVDIPLYTYPSQGENDYGRVLESVDQEVNDLMSSFILMWPQTYAELVENPAINGARLEIKYKVRTVTNNEPNDSDELTAVIVLGNQGFFKTNQIGMDAGKKYTYTLQFKKSTMDIYVNVLPWEYEEYDWNYAEHSISARSGTFKDGVLAFYRYNSETDAYDISPNTNEWSAKAIRFNTRNEVFKGRFFIEAPTAGRWQITPYPLSAAQYFIVEPTSGDINVNVENGMAEFTVKTNPDRTPTSTQNLYFNVAIQLNGEWVDANSEFNRKNIRLVLDAN